MENKQGSKEWFNVRYGRFTGSQIYRLLGVKGLGETGKTYCFENAVEIVFGKDEDEQFESFDIKRGNELEPLAFRKFKELKAFDFIEVEECSFFPYGYNAGASPDGLVGKDAILEIKSPRSTKLFNLIAKGVEAIDKEYIAQVQMEIMCTNSTHGYFFNYGIFNGKEIYHEIVLQRDEVMIDLIKARILEAVEIRDAYVLDLRKNIQF